MRIGHYKGIPTSRVPAFNLGYLRCSRGSLENSVAVMLGL